MKDLNIYLPDALPHTEIPAVMWKKLPERRKPR